LFTPANAALSGQILSLADEPVSVLVSLPFAHLSERSMASDKDLAYEVLRAIRQIVRRISEHSKFLAREVGLTLPQLMCLKAIGELEEETSEVTVASVAGRVHLSAATVSRILDRLVAADLVLRERRAKDRRKVCLSLTPGGFERFQTLPTPLQEQFVDRLLALAPEDRQTILATLRRTAELMQAAELEAAPILAPGSDVRADPAPED
jgi:DNA-binding MarR family transcriptional regulator